MPTHLAEFEISRKAKQIWDSIRRNRKFLNEKFAERSYDGSHVDFENAKEIIRSVMRGIELDDDQFKVIFKGALRENNMVEFKRLGKDVKAKFS